jgi:hypothetical protein
MSSPGFGKYEVGLSAELALRGQPIKFVRREGEKAEDGMIDFRFGHPPANCDLTAPLSKMGYAVIQSESVSGPTKVQHLNYPQFQRLFKNPDGTVFPLDQEA